MSETNQGRLLGGRVTYAQPASGHRTGIEPVLLAAFVPARAGERVLEGGTGAGAGLLCLAARVGAIEGLGLEADPELVALANTNFAANGFACRAQVAGLPDLPPGAPAAHAMANPPWHHPGSTQSPDPGRRLARRRSPDLIAAWAGALAGALRPGGTLSMIVPASLHPETARALTDAGCGALVLFPLWPRREAAAKLVLLRGVRGSRSPAQILPGLVLHEADGAFTPEAQTVLRGGAGLGAASL